MRHPASTRPVLGTVEQRDRPTAGTVEDRRVPADSVQVEGRRLRGIVPFGVESRDLGGWTEIIEPRALDGVRLDDLVLTVDHAGIPLARHPQTLTVEQRDDGMHWHAEIPESRSDVREAVERGDLQAGSWRMIVGRDRWDGNVRHIEEIRELHDVAVVTRPAYGNGARVELRSENGSRSAGDRRVTGALQVEDRAATGRRNVEARVLDAMAAVPQGESRDLTHATADPVEPPELATLVWDRLRAQSVVLASGVPVIPTNRGTVHWPTITGDMTAAFYDELEQIDESDPGLDEIEVAVKAIKALVRGSSEAFEDSDPDLLALVQAHLQTILALKLDRELLIGEDPKGFDGLAVIAGTTTIDLAGEPLTYDTLLRAAGSVAGNNGAGQLATYAHPWVATALNRQTDQDGNPLQAPPGVPQVRSTSQLPVAAGVDPAPDTSTVLVVPPSQIAVVRRRDVTIEVDRSQEFSSDAVLVRGKLRAGLVAPYPQVIVKLENVATIDPATA